MSEPVYQRFLGDWTLDVATCEYEQGEPPQSGTYRIEASGDEVNIAMDWIDAEGESHHVSFRGRPDGSRMPFNGGPLADALAITAPSQKELNSAAFRDGVELMTATRTLSDDGVRMIIEQTVHLPDGTSPTNVGVYHRRQ